MNRSISDNLKFVNRIYKTQDKLTKAFSANMFRVFTLMSIEQIEELDKGQLIPVKANGKTYLIIDAKNTKVVISEDYNFIFDKRNGHFSRWGTDYKDDPNYSPIGGEILDIEITTICNGPDGKTVCPFCYKSNTNNGLNMPFDTFKTIIDKMPKSLTQVAFGSDAMGTSNPDLFKMAEYCRSIGVVPNLTIANVSDEISDKLVSVMGAVAVSRYSDKNICYDSIKRLTDRGNNQINMHFCVFDESYDQCMETLIDIKRDPRLSKLNAIVLLSLKKKGRGTKYNTLSKDKYDTLVKYCLDNDINFGMDSCSAVKFLDSIKSHDDYEKFKVVVEPCESTNFSQYIDVNGRFYPCSFCEEIEGWEDGINVANCKDYLEDIWYNDRVVGFRNKLNNNCDNCHKARECPIYTV